MKSFRSVLIVITAALFLGAASEPAPRQGELALWRLDCGYLEDTNGAPWGSRRLPVSCYLVRHGRDYLLFDAGLSARLIGAKQPTMELQRSIIDQLRQIDISPDQIKYLVVSHYHGDHAGQAIDFPHAQLLIGTRDLDALKSSAVPEGAAPSYLRPWLEQGSPLRPLIEDFDVFGDGTVTVLMTPGHTPGHTALLVKLKGRPVIMSGDLWLSHDELLTGDMPSFNTSFAETEASRQRIRRLALQHHAILVIGHEERDIAALPLFPKPAE